MLTNNPDIFRYFYGDENYHFAYLDGMSFQHFQSGFKKWENCAVELSTLLYEKGKQIKRDINQHFNLYHGVIFCRKNFSDMEVFEFASETLSIYFCHRNIFENFFVYFREAARKYILEASKEKIFFPEKI